MVIQTNQRPTNDGGGWFGFRWGNAEIWVSDPVNAPCEPSNRFVWVRSSSITYLSCYFTPSETVDKFQEKLGRLEDTIRFMELGLMTSLQKHWSREHVL